MHPAEENVILKVTISPLLLRVPPVSFLNFIKTREYEKITTLKLKMETV